LRQAGALHFAKVLGDLPGNIRLKIIYIALRPQCKIFGFKSKSPILYNSPLNQLLSLFICYKSMSIILQEKPLVNGKNTKQ